MENSTAPAPKFHNYSHDVVRNEITKELKYFGIKVLTRKTEITTSLCNSKAYKEEKKVSYIIPGFITFYYQITNKFS